MACYNKHKAKIVQVSCRQFSFHPYSKKKEHFDLYKLSRLIVNRELKLSTVRKCSTSSINYANAFLLSPYCLPIIGTFKKLFTFLVLGRTYCIYVILVLNDNSS